MWKYWWNESQNIYHLSQGQDIKRLITLISEGLGMHFFSLQIWSLWDHFYFDLFEPPTKSVEPLSNISEKTGMMVHRIASFDQLHWWTTIENHQTQWWGTQKPSEYYRSSMVSPNHSIQWWWLLWKPSKNCDGKINHICQIWLLTENFYTHRIQLINAMKGVP